MATVTFCILLILFVAGTFGAISRVRSGTHITPIVQNTTLESIYGFRPCENGAGRAGPGQIIDWRLTGCSPDTICSVVRGEINRGEVDFTPRNDVAQLGLRLNRIKDGKVVDVYESPIADSSVVGGSSYTLHCSAGVTKELEPGTYTYQVTFYSLADNSVEACSEVEFLCL